MVVRRVQRRGRVQVSERSAAVSAGVGLHLLGGSGHRICAGGKRVGVAKNRKRSRLHRLVEFPEIASLIKSNEPLGGLIISCHNLNYYKNFMNDIRLSIENNSFDDFKRDFYFKRNSS